MRDSFYLMRIEGIGSPKRGDLMQTAVGTSRERTWFIWFSKKAAARIEVRGKLECYFRVLRVRWWEIEPETRIALARSAERHGGQIIWRSRREHRPN